MFLVSIYSFTHLRIKNNFAELAFSVLELGQVLVFKLMSPLIRGYRTMESVIEIVCNT